METTKYSQGFKNEFNFWYSFVGFAEATGLKSPVVSAAYNNFKGYCWARVCEDNLGIMPDLFESWCKQTKFLLQRCNQSAF